MVSDCPEKPKGIGEVVSEECRNECKPVIAMSALLEPLVKRLGEK
jgi:hypothetical protein